MGNPTLNDTIIFVTNACGYLGLSPRDQMLAALAASIHLSEKAGATEEELHRLIAEGYAAKRPLGHKHRE